MGGPAFAALPEDALTPRRPALLLFVAAADAGSCCASNYERFVFRDRKVVGLGEKEFVTLRVDRARLKDEDLARFELKKERPSLLVLDCEGRTFARWDLCANSSDVYKAMVLCLKASSKKAKATLELEQQLSDARALVEQGSLRGATMLLRKVLREDGAFAAAHRLAERALADIAARGRALVDDALAISEPTARFDALVGLRHELWFTEPLIDEVKQSVTALEEGEATAALIFDHKGQLLVNEAAALLEKGKTAQGRGILRKVSREFAGTAAAERADALLE